jgi:hypothetical protein
LHVLPVEDDEKLWCTFSIASLDDHPEYEAASYVWGSWDDPRSIEIGADEVVVSITKNLQSVLRSVRSQDDPRTLWVHALCINQQDLEERGSQVGMMARVYAQATCVLAYLGDYFEGCERAIDVIQQIADDPALHLLSKEPEEDVKTKEVVVESTVKERHQPSCRMHSSNLNKAKSVEAHKEVGLKHPELLGHLVTFLDTPWMTRVWTVQEFTRAKAVTLIYGGTAISAETTMRFCRHRSDHLTCCNLEPITQAWERFWTLANNWNSLAAVVEKDYSYSNMRFLELCRIRNATDQRDKVYSLLGMSHAKWVKVLLADYTIPTEETFIRAVLADVQFAHLDFLSFCHARESPGIRCKTLPARLNLPSWVPSWSVPTTDLFTNNAMFMLDARYSACGVLPIKIEFVLPTTLNVLEALSALFHLLAAG